MSRKQSATPATLAATGGSKVALRTQLELDKLKYDLLSGLPKQSIVTMTNSAGGEVYEGQVDGKNKRSGKGTLKWPNGNVYFGQWVDSSMCGSGTFIYAVENDVYKGEFKDDKKHGQGKYEFSNGNFYEGSFAVDKRHGRGRYSWTCGDSYEGEWFEGHMQGKGTTVYSNGNRYDGEFVADRREGKGKLVCADGLSYEGMWLKNMRHGVGRLQFPNGDFYEGEWDNDKKHGKGTDCFVNGNKFVGQYRDNVKHGQGTMTYANGDKYAGEWKGDKMEGQGRYDFSNGFLYEGSWVADVRHGQGKYIFPSGHVYIGEWKSDKRHGTGQLTIAPSGDVYKGTWADGKMHGSFVVERKADWQELPAEAAAATSGEGKKFPTFSGPLRKIYEGQWELGVPTKGGTFFIFTTPDARQPSASITGEWDASQATKKSDGTIETPSTDHWRAMAIVAQLSNTGKKPHHLLCAMDHQFDGMTNRPLADFYDTELQSYMPGAATQTERLQRCKKYADVIQKLEQSVDDGKQQLIIAQKSAGASDDSAESLLSTIQSIEEQCVDRQSKLSASELRASEMESQIKGVQESTKQLKSNLDGVAKQKDEMKSAKSTAAKLEAQCQAAEKEVASLKEKTAKLQTTDIPTARGEWETLREEVDGSLVGQKATKASALAEAKKDYMAKETSLKDATKKANDAAARNRDAKTAGDQAVQRLTAQVAVVGKQVADADKQKALKQKKSSEDLKKRQETEQQQFAQNTSELDRLRLLKSSTEQALQRLRDSANDGVDEKQRVEGELSDARALLTAAREQRVEAAQESTRLDVTMERLQEHLVSLRQQELAAAKDAEATNLSRRKSELSALEAKLRQQETGKSILDGELEPLDSQLAQLLAQREKLTAELHSLQNEEITSPLSPSSPKKPKDRNDDRSPKSKRKGSQAAEDPSAPQPAAMAGRLRRGSTQLVVQTREDSSDEGTRGGTPQELRIQQANEVEEKVAELTKRLSQLNRNNDDDEVQIERELRKKRQLEDDIKALNDELSGKAVQAAAALFASNAPNVSLDLTEAGKEAVRHQLIKARTKQTSLLKDQDKLRNQFQCTMEQVEECSRQRQEGSQYSIAAIIAGLRPEDWRLSYLAEQIETKGKTIADLEHQCGAISILEEQLQSLKETISGLQSRQSGGGGGGSSFSGGGASSSFYNGTMGASSRRPPPF